MGKSKRKRRPAKVNVPHAVDPEERKPNTDEQPESNKPDFIEELLSNIANADYEETIESSLAALANVAMGEDEAKAMMSHGLVRQLGPLLLHKSSNIKEKVAGTLRNISASGGIDVCAMMADQDIMTCLCESIKQNVNAEFSDARILEAENCRIPEMQHLLMQLANLTWNVCEASATATKVFNDENLVVHFMRMMKGSHCSRELMVACAHCLFATTEDNLLASTILSKDLDFVTRLTSMLRALPPQSDTIVLQSLAAGILYNVTNSVTIHVRNEFQVLMLDLIVAVLSINSNTKVSSPEEVEKIYEVLYAQQICLELLSNLFCSEDDPADSWEDMDEDAEDGDLESDAVSEDPLSGDSQALIAEMLRRNVPQLILQRCVSPNRQNEALIVEQDKQSNYAARSHRVQSRALLCLNNMLSLPSLVSCFTEPEISALWVTLIGLLQRNKDGTLCYHDNEFLDAVTAAMRSVANQLAKMNNTDFVTGSTFILLNEIMATIDVGFVRVNIIGLLGAAGKLLCQRKETTNELQAIGTTFQAILDKMSSLLLIAETLDAVFETFADGVDGSVNEAFANLGLMATLRKVSQGIRTRMRSERRSLGTDYPIVDNARVNLIRFIKYKESH